MRNEDLIRLSMKPELSPDDQARLEIYLAAHPELRVLWEQERALGRALQSLPDVPVSSNFTARVLQAVDLEETRAERATRPETSWARLWLPRIGWSTAALALTLMAAHQYRTTVERNRLAQDVAFVTEDISKLPPEVLRDFRLIESLHQASDAQLLTALQ